MVFERMLVVSDYLDRIKALPITSYAQSLGFTLVRVGRFYSLREHDSVRIDTEKNAFWRNSVFHGRGTGGSGSIIDFAMEFGGYGTAADAIDALASKYGIPKGGRAQPIHRRLPATPKQTPAEEAMEQVTAPITVDSGLKLPPKGENSKAMFHYLIKERNIDLSVVRYLHAKKMIYEDINKNCVFVSGEFACTRGTQGSFMGDISGSDYNQGFFLRGNSNADTLVVTESPIDMMSVMTFFAKNGERYTNYCYLAICGVGKLQSLYRHLESDTGINQILLSLDNDRAGRRATQSAIARLKEMGFEGAIVEHYPPQGKDWNEYISLALEQKQHKSMSEYRTQLARTESLGSTFEKPQPAISWDGTSAMER